MDLLFIPILIIFGFLVRDVRRMRIKEEEVEFRSEPPPDHAYRSDLSAAVARADALERELQEFRSLPDASEDVQILPDTRPDVSDFTKLCPDNVRTLPDGRIMTGSGRIWPDNDRIWPGNGRVMAGWQDNTVRYPWSEDLKPGHYIQTNERYGVVVIVEDDQVWVHFDNGVETWRRWVKRL